MAICQPLDVSERVPLSVDDDLAGAYETVTLADVRAVLNRYPLSQQTTLALGPLSALRRSMPASGRVNALSCEGWTGR